MGHVISKVGLKPDESKVTAITDMPDPTSKEDLLRIMGMINYLSQFIPNLSTITTPLRSLLKKDTAWIWEPQHAAALKTLKTLISSKPVLKFFDITKDTVIQCDVSSTGLEACLLQDNHPIAYASRKVQPVCVMETSDSTVRPPPAGDNYQEATAQGFTKAPANVVLLVEIQHQCEVPPGKTQVHCGYLKPCVSDQ